MLSFEMALANISSPWEERKNYDMAFQSTTLGELTTIFPIWDWTFFINSLELASVKVRIESNWKWQLCHLFQSMTWLSIAFSPNFTEVTEMENPHTVGAKFQRNDPSEIFLSTEISGYYDCSHDQSCYTGHGPMTTGTNPFYSCRWRQIKQ